MYRTDVAAIHHEGFTTFARRASPGLLGLLRAARIRPGATVVDLGCGSGVWLARLVEAGYRGIGVDQSPACAKLARQVAPSASIRVGSVYRTIIPRCQAITALGEVLSYLPAPRLEPFFRRVAHALEPGGLFVFDLMIRRRRPASYRSWSAGAHWAAMVEVSENTARTGLKRSILTFRRVGRGYRRSQETHRLRLVARAEVEAALRSAGFRCRAIRGYGRHRLAPGRLGFIATRPGGPR
ncbi:MAG: class I SAM-dependent methyltransferase [Gemmatimonadales bacterium]